MEKNELKEISLLNVFTTLLVILGHSGCIYAGKWNYELVYMKSNSIKYITEYIYSFHMPLFVLISGYLYAYGKERGKYISFKELVTKKFNRLIVPYLLVGVLFMIPIQMLFKIDNLRVSYVSRVFNEIIFAKEPRHLWFLLMLFNLFIIFYIIEKFLNRNSIKANIFILFIISISSIVIPNIYNISSSFQYLIYFYIGYIFFNKYKTLHINKYKLICLAIVQIIAFNLNYLFLSNSTTLILKLVNLFTNRMLSLVSVISVFVIYKTVYRKLQKLCNRIMTCKLYLLLEANTLFI